ncbi:MAG: hypothetical protein PSV18_09285 [Methylobacter sp.]|nr:hypothetical protein [Candidatus Methylobacter titanis]
MAAIMISVDDINFENLSCNNRGVHIWIRAWLGPEVEGKVVAIDGKTLRGNHDSE